MKPIRPQVLGILIGLVGLGVYGLYLGVVEIATGSLGALAVLSTKLVDLDAN